MQEIDFNDRLESIIDRVATYLRITFDEAAQIMCASAATNMNEAKMHNLYKAVPGLARAGLVNMFVDQGYRVRSRV